MAATFCPSLGDADRVRLRESVNSPLEKAGEMLIFSKQKGARVKDNHFSNGTAQNSVAVCADGFGKPSPVGEGGAVYRDG